MKEITVLSGKGGTGKTSITAAIASIQPDLILCDCDVDAADLHLILEPSAIESHVYEGSWMAQIDSQLCNDCGICSEYCRFDAIISNGQGTTIDPYKCEGCRLCERICPADAISSIRSRGNSWYVSVTRFGKMIHASMAPGEENSGKLVTEVRRKARELAREELPRYILNDGPPGTGCPVIASITGADAILMVVEPAKSSLHDAGRVVDLAEHFGLPVFSIINKYDMNPEMSVLVTRFLKERSIPLLGRIPFDESFVKAMVKGKTIVEFDPECAISTELNLAWNHLSGMLM